MPPHPEQSDDMNDDMPALEPIVPTTTSTTGETSQSSVSPAAVPIGDVPMDAVDPEEEVDDDDNDDDMPALQSVSDSSDEDSDSDRDADEVEMQAVQDDHDPAWTDEDIEMPGLEPIGTSTPRGANRRARVDDDEDDERDRRHPSQRVGNPIDDQNRTPIPNSNPIPPTPQQLPPLPPLLNGGPRIRATINIPTFLRGPDPFGQNTNAAGNPNAVPPMFGGGFAITIDLNGTPVLHQHGPGLAAPQTPGGENFGNFRDFLGLFGQAFGLGMETEQEDPERAKRLVDALEVVPEGLVRRLEHVGDCGGQEGEGGGSGGDIGCAICWDKLLDGEGEGWVVDTKTDGDAQEGEASSSSRGSSPAAPTPPKIVSLPCAHVFHASCLIPWFSRPRQTTCPTCRFNIDPENLTYVRRRPPPPAAPANPQTGPAAAAAPPTAPTMNAAAAPVPANVSADPGPPTAPASEAGEEHPDPPLAGIEPPPAPTPAANTNPDQPDITATNPDATANPNPNPTPANAQAPATGFLTIGFDLFFGGPQGPMPGMGMGPPGGMGENMNDQGMEGIDEMEEDAMMQALQEDEEQMGRAWDEWLAGGGGQGAAGAGAGPQGQPPVQGQGQPFFGTAPGGGMQFAAGSGRTVDEAIASIFARQNGTGPPTGPAPAPGAAPTAANVDTAGNGNAPPQPPQFQDFLAALFGPGGMPRNTAPPAGGATANATPAPNPNPNPNPNATTPPTPTTNNALPTFANMFPPGFLGAGPAPPAAGNVNHPATTPPTTTTNALPTIANLFPTGLPGAGPAPAAGNANANTNPAPANANGPAPPLPPLPQLGAPPDFARLFAGFPGRFPGTGPAPAATAGAPPPQPQAPQFHTHAHPVPLNPFTFGNMGPRPPRPPREKKAWTLPPAPGPTLRQRIEKKEREAGLRCYDVSCGVGPSDEEPFAALGEAQKRQLSIQAPTRRSLEHGEEEGEHGHEEGEERRSVCPHTFHPSCLVSAARVALMGEDAVVVDGVVEVACSVCRGVGNVAKGDWDEGVQALT
ncbi:hypothetical protein Hypma_016441 [Hypsizygus marmoreus]|uniref:RING-type domain-containing protein n=1 Tax=Hypsizygus marmoreus TaxID=39966 RepID=A0A369IXW0_HYPMA|nr:hypothetical protein Hypma_016441 [Hypsizygus marmoreus]